MTNSDKIGLVIIITSVTCVAAVVFLFIKVFSLEHEISSLEFSDSQKTNNLASDFSNLTTNSANSSNGSNSTSQTSTTSATDRDASRKTNLATIAAGLEQYKSAKGSYPISSTVTKLNNASSDVASKLSPYISLMPLDPLDPQFYYGYQSDNGTGYILTAVLENTKDPEAVQSGSLALYKIEKNSLNQTPTVPDTSTSNISNNTTTDDSNANTATDSDDSNASSDTDNSSDDSSDDFIE